MRTYYFEYKDTDQHYYFKATVNTGIISAGTQISVYIQRLTDKSKIKDGYTWSVYNCWENMTERQMIEDIDTRLAKIREIAW